MGSDKQCEDFIWMTDDYFGSRLRLGLKSSQDCRIWKLESSCIFSCKPFFKQLVEDDYLLFFILPSSFWKSEVQKKVEFLTLLIALHKVNALNNVHKKSPSLHLGPHHWYILCKSRRKSVDHLFQHFAISSHIWFKLLLETGLGQVFPKHRLHLLVEHQYSFLGNKKAKILQNCETMAIFWVI